MPVYSMDMKLKLQDDSVLDGQYFLTIGYPKSNRWGICSSDDALQGLKGTFNYSEKLGFEGTTCFQGETEQNGEFAVISLRLRVFRGGVIDSQSWRVGKGGTGFWVRKPRADIKNDFEWVIRKIDTSNDL
jgi:hypothetical protein